MTFKKEPMRTCVACREEKPKREMIRIVKNAAGEIRVDFSGKLSGRGAYLCTNPACAEKLKRHRLLNRTFSMEVPSSVYELLEEELRAKE